MGRVRAKGRKLSVGNQDDPGSGEEVKVLAHKRRGRPQKSPKDDEIDEDEPQQIEDEDSEDSTDLPNKDVRDKTGTHNGKRQKTNAQAREKVDSVKEENGNGNKSTSEDIKMSNGFRLNGNRRKNKPCRAAEAVVECN